MGYVFRDELVASRSLKVWTGCRQRMSRPAKAHEQLLSLAQRHLC